MKAQSFKQKKAMHRDIINSIIESNEDVGTALKEVRRYINDFPYSPDYNIYRYGTMGLLVWNNEIFDFFKKYGIDLTNRMNDDDFDIADFYTEQVGIAVKKYLVPGREQDLFELLIGE